MHEARAALARIPLFKGADPADLVVTGPLAGGLTNRSYRIDGPAGGFALRIAGEGTAAYIDRAAEARNARAAAEAGVGPEVDFAEPESGLLLTRWIEGARPLDGTALREPARIPRAADALRRLHDRAPPFEGNREPFADIAAYEAALRAAGLALPSSGEAAYEAVRSDLEALHGALPHPGVVSCHCDPAPANLLDSGGRVWLVDYEYAGLADAMWDLGFLAGEAVYGEAGDGALLAAYLGRAPTPPETARMALYKAICDLMGALWSLVQYMNKNEDERFLGLSQERFERCRALLASEAFSRHAQVLREG